MMIPRPFLWLLAAMAGLATTGHPQGVELASKNDISWSVPGTNENDSLPLGNGDLALNVWTEPNGDLLVLAAKADAWSENGQLLKLGRVRLKLTPNPFLTQDTRQTLHLGTAEISLTNQNNHLHVWVDANRSVAHIDLQTKTPVQVEAAAELWRTRPYHLAPGEVSAGGFFEWGGNPHGLDFQADTVLPAGSDQITWCHFNTNSIYPLVLSREHLAGLTNAFPDPLWHRCFGLAARGKNLSARTPLTLGSRQAGKHFHLELHALTETGVTPERWQADLQKQIQDASRVTPTEAWADHQSWWQAFWERSWLVVDGSPAARAVSQSYAMQRFMTACTSRGAQPAKFNGSLFTVGHDLPPGVASTEASHDPDYRAWGNSYWNQNNRFIYWPLLATGDFDLLQPWFEMYRQALPMATARTREYFHHDGAAFIETMYFWGLPNVNDFGWNNQGVELQSEWMRYHVQGGLEIIAQMLDRYEYTMDRDFARTNLVPMAEAITTYYDQHWARDPAGKLRLSPAQSIETYQVDAVNPTPDLAGLRSVLPRLLALPPELMTAAAKNQWQRQLQEIPPLPLGTTAGGKLPPLGRGDAHGQPVILPAEQYGSPRNRENPELYPVFPYRLYGVGQPDLELARNTFAARLYPFGKCWGQDGVEAALLGLTETAQKVVQEEFTAYGNQRFPWFWSRNSDWIPDMDNGGAGMETLQLMLLQCQGETIRLLPAWPPDWSADFKLHVPGGATISGQVRDGKVTQWQVFPKEFATRVRILGAP